MDIKVVISRRKRDRVLEGAIAVAQQHSVVHSQVRLAIAVEVGHRHQKATCSSVVDDSALECAVTIAQQDRDAGVGAPSKRIASVGYSQVEVTVAVKVAHGDTIWIYYRAVLCGGLESAVTIAQQHQDTAVSKVVRERSFVGHDQVELAIPIEITHRNGNRAHSGRVAGGGLEGPIAVA